MRHVHQQKGFTLIELLVTMGIGLVIMAGMTSVFVSQTRTATMLKNKTEAMGDLFLASQIMQSELRSSQAICQVSATVLAYQPNNSTTPCTSATVNGSNGSFELCPASATKPTPYICWNRPNGVSSSGCQQSCQELIRGLPVASGMTVTPKVAAAPLPTMYVVDLKSLFRGQDNQSKNLGLTFKVWARN